MQPLLAGLELKLPVVEFNGAFISDVKTGRHETVNALDPAVAGELLGMLRKASRSLFVSTFDGHADHVYYGAIVNDGERYYVANRREHDDPRLRQVENVAGALREQVVCMTVIDRLETLADLERAVVERFADSIEVHLFENWYSPGWCWLTVHDRRATKDRAIQAIRQDYGLGNHELMVFGDHKNDMKMFRIATLAIAVTNAHPEVKRHATHVIGSNEKDSVVRFIEGHSAGRHTTSGWERG
jgi:HAD superfamily hydrolase (TIGR01484 family)